MPSARSACRYLPRGGVTEIHGSVPEKDLLMELVSAEDQSDRVLLPTFETRQVGDLVFSKTTDAEVLAINLESGLIEWPYYLSSAPHKMLGTPDPRNMGASAALSEQLKTRVWGSTAFGRFSCDRQRFYYVTRDSRAPMGGNQAKLDANFLQGLSIAGEGKILWQVGGPEDDVDRDFVSVTEPRLNGAFFLGPPLSHEGDLYAIVEIKGETRLVVLDPDSGELRWSQQLIQSSSSQLREDTERRNLALSPTISDGVVLCPTGAGAVVAVDLLTRQLRWGFSYTTRRDGDNSPHRFQAGFSNLGATYNPLDSRWLDSAMIAQDGMVIVSPPESETFFCRRILDGSEVLGPHRRNDGRYIAGVRDDGLIVVAERHIFCVDTREKAIRWEVEFPDRHRLAGKGLWLKDRMMVPLTNRRLIEISTRDGRVLSEATVDQPLGNLFAFRGNLISCSATSVAAFYTRDHLRRDVQERLAENSEDVWALNQSAQLAFADGETDEAIRLLDTALGIEPENVDSRYLMTETILAGLESDFAKYESLTGRLQELVELGPQKSRLLQWLALGNLRSNSRLEALEYLLQLVKDRTAESVSGAQTRNNDIRLTESRVVHLDIWLATEIARMHENATTAERAEIERRIQAALTGVDDVVISFRRQLLKYFAWHPAASQSIVNTAISLFERQDPTSAEQLLIPLSHSQNPQVVEMANRLLARRTIYDSQQFGPQGRFFSSLYGNRIYAGQPAEQEEFNTSVDLQTPARWNQGLVRRVSVEGGRTPFAYAQHGIQLPQVTERFGKPRFEVRLSSNVVLICNSNGEDVARLDFDRASSDTRDTFTRATVRGWLLIIETSSEVVGFDLYRGLRLESPRDALLWRQSLLQPAAGRMTRFQQSSLNPVNTSFGVQLHHRQLAGRNAAIGPLTAAGLILQLGSSVVSIDAYTGRKNWTREGYGDQIWFAGHGTQLAIVNPALARTEILDCRDGRLLDSKDFQGDWKPWFSAYGKLVDYSEVEARQPEQSIGRSRRPILRVWDPFTGEDIHRLELPLGARANQCENRFVVAVEPGGQLHYLDLKTMEYRQWSAATDEQLQEIYLERFGNTLSVLCNSKDQPVRGGQNRGNSSLDLNLRDINGRVYAIAIDQPQLLWDHPGRLFGFKFSRSQPRNSPFLVAHRIQPIDRLLVGTLAVIDLRTGRMATSVNNILTRTQSGFAMQLVPRLQRIDVSLGGRELHFLATTKDRPPQPVVQFGHLPEAPKPPSIQSLFR